MQVVQKMLCIAALLVVGGCAAPGGGSQGEGVAVARADDRYSVTAPQSRLTLSFAKGNWLRKEQAKADASPNPKYFRFEDNKDNSLLLSGWFEPASASIGLLPQWDSALKVWEQKGLPKPVNVLFEKLGDWEVVWYDHYLGTGVSSHLRGHRVQAGTWIDLHIATTSRASSADNRKVLKRLLQDIVVTERSEN